MRFLVRAFFSLLVLAVLVACVAYYMAGRQPGPSIAVRTPEKFVGQSTPVEFAVETPGGQFSLIEAALEQDGQSHTIFSSDPQQPQSGELKQDSADRVVIS